MKEQKIPKFLLFYVVHDMNFLTARLLGLLLSNPLLFLLLTRNKNYSFKGEDE